MTKRTAGKAAHTPIPGWADLLPYTQPLAIPADQADRIGKAIEQVGWPLREGVQAIGELLWMAAENKELEVVPRTLFQIGVLITHLTELMALASQIETAVDWAKAVEGGAA